MSALNHLIERLAAKNAVSAEDALAIRRQIWPDGRVAGVEAELLFALNDAVAEPSREWVDCFVEAVCEHVVGQGDPRGYVDDATAAWLIDRVKRDGRVETLAELELLVRVVEKALNAPAALKSFALDEIERLVLTGGGPTRGGALEPGAITAADVKLIRRVIFASGGEGPASVSAAEAEMLFRLKDATLGRDNAPEWRTLFVQGVANFLQAYNGHRPLELGEARRLEAFMNDTRVRVGRVLGGMARAATSFDRLRQAVERQARPDHDAEVAAAEAVTPAEADWLESRMDRDGARDPLERALLDFLADQPR